MAIKTEDRSRFVYETGYGKTTDMYLLPIGTEFYTENGAWSGKIIEKDGKPHLFVNYTQCSYRIDPDTDCGLAITITKRPRTKDELLEELQYSEEQVKELQKELARRA